ncbi:MAG: hypothetical protein ACI9IJ_002294, partial [Psychromonas sp.]
DTHVKKIIDYSLFKITADYCLQKSAAISLL